MSLLNEFKNDLPMSINTLIGWIKRILTELDTCTIDYTTFSNICGCNQGTNITTHISVDTFDEIYEAVNTSKKLEIDCNGHYLNILAASTMAVPSDDFYAVSLVVIDTDSKYKAITISKMMGVMYLDSKTICSLTS